jgi:hypothetical protein
MSEPLNRREAVRRLAIFSAAATLPAWLGCGKRDLTCTSTAGLTADETALRTQTAGYVDRAPNPAQKCNNCAQWVPAGPDQCGGCKVIKGPIHPEGWCKLWVAQPT